MKDVIYTIVIIIVVVIIINHITPYKETEIIYSTEIIKDTVYVTITDTIPADTVIIILPDTTDTSYQDTIPKIKPDTLAKVNIPIDQNDIKGNIYVEYSYQKQEFQIKISLSNIKETKTITKKIKPEKTAKLFKIGMTTAYNHKEKFGIGVGIFINEKIMVSPIINTDNTYSLNISYLF